MTRIVFMGTPEFSVPVLEGLTNDKEYQVVGVISQPDKKVGRHQVLTPSPVSTFALSHNLPLLRISKIKTDYEDVMKLEPDLIITCAYGQIIPKELLNYPKLGCINVHASLLPKLRGGAPIHRAIIEGYNKTGITIMYMDETMDTGDIIAQEEIEIAYDDTVDTLHDKLSLLGRNLLLKTLPSIIMKKNNRIKQNHQEATYAPNIKREDEHLDFTKSAKELYNQIRGLNSFPGAFAILDDKVVKIYSAKISGAVNKRPGEIINIYKDGIGVATADKELIITTLQEEGRKKMTAKDYLNSKTKESLLKKQFK